MNMPKITRLVGVLLVIEGLGFYVATGTKSITALIPTLVGLPILVLGILAFNASAQPRDALGRGTGSDRFPRRGGTNGPGWLECLSSQRIGTDPRPADRWVSGPMRQLLRRGSAAKAAGFVTDVRSFAIHSSKELASVGRSDRKDGGRLRCGCYRRWPRGVELRGDWPPVGWMSVSSKHLTELAGGCGLTM